MIRATCLPTYPQRLEQLRSVKLDQTREKQRLGDAQRVLEAAGAAADAASPQERSAAMRKSSSLPS